MTHAGFGNLYHYLRKDTDQIKMYEIVAPNGMIHRPPDGNCWKIIRSEFEKALADGRVTFGIDGKGVPRRKQFLSETKGLVPWS